jgi:hypothetical protein
MTELFAGAAGNPSGGPILNKNQGNQPPEWEAQEILGAMMSSPEKPLMSLIQERYPNRDTRFYGNLVTLARTAIDELIGGLHRSTDAGPTPILVDRLSFTWRILRQADILARKTKKSALPQNTDLSHVQAAFSTILPRPFTKLHAPLLAALVEWLRLGSDGRYFYHYWCFRRATNPTRLPDPFSTVVSKQDLQLLRTLIWWCLRARREGYVEVAENDSVRVEYGFVVEEVLKDLKGWCGADIDHFPGVADEVEKELDRWLRYSRLDLSAEETLADNVRPDPELAKAFINHNGLDIKLRIHRSAASGPSDERVRQLEATIQQYADEIRTLEDRIRNPQSTPVPADTSQSCLPPPSDVPEPDIAGFTELREVLKTIDSKYAFDILNAVQLGEETHLTFRSFAAHLFYALRRRGFSEYPKDETFDLSYEASGLYECEGFEVSPGSSVPVKVTRKGWALRARGRWLPVRRARVSRVAGN